MALAKKKKVFLFAFLGVYLVLCVAFVIAKSIDYKVVDSPESKLLAETRKKQMVDKFKEKEKEKGQYRELTPGQIDKVYADVFEETPEQTAQKTDGASLAETRRGMIKEVFGREGFYTEEHVKRTYDILYGPKAEESKKEERLAAIRKMFAENQALLVSPLTDAQVEELYNTLYGPKLGVIAINFTMIMQILNFAALVTILYVLLWEPLIKFLDVRKEKIAGDIAAAEAEKAEAEKIHQEYRRRLHDARDDAAKLVEEGRRRGEEKEREILADARKEAERIKERSSAELASAESEARRELRKEFAAVSVGIAEKILAREIKDADQASLVEQALAGLEKEGVKFE